MRMSLKIAGGVVAILLVVILVLEYFSGPTDSPSGSLLFETVMYILLDREDRLDELTTYPEFKSFIAACEADAQPTHEKNVVVYDPNYDEGTGRKWAFIIRSHRHRLPAIRMGDYEVFFIFGPDGTLRIQENAYNLLQNTDGLKFYYCYLKKTPAKNP